MSSSNMTRRELFRRGGALGSLVAVPALLKGAAQSAPPPVSAVAAPTGANR